MWGYGEIHSRNIKINMIGGNRVLRKLIERAFCNGVAVGISLYQRMILATHEKKKPFKIGEDFYYIYSGRERLAEMLDKICR